MINKCEIEMKQQEVRINYSQYGFHSKEYNESFDELHDMQMQYMAQNFRRARGAGPGTRTPYDPS